MLRRLFRKTNYIIKNAPRKSVLKDIRSDLKYINIPKLNAYVPQGICIIDNYILITLYDGDKKNNSKIIILNDNKIYKTIYVDNKYHLGGISYDPIHNIIWITTTDGCISGYNKYDIFNANNSIVTPYYKNIKLGDDFINIFNKNSIAYIAYNDNKIYVGNYNTNKNSFMKIFNINNDGSININSFKTIPFTSYTQGITFYKNYIIASSSWGKTGKSKLTILNNNKIKDVYYLPSMMEQIAINNNQLYLLFEINAIKYNNKDTSRSDIIILNINNFIN